LWLKQFNAQLLLLYLGILGEGMAENVISGERFAENDRIPSYEGRRSKIA